MGIKRIGRIKDSTAQKNAIVKHVNKKVYNKGVGNEQKSLLDAGRIKNSDSEGFNEVGFFPLYMAEWADADVNEYCNELIAEHDIYSPYDCTGKLFIAFIDWHRNASGLISYNIGWRLDV